MTMIVSLPNSLSADRLVLLDDMVDSVHKVTRKKKACKIHSGTFKGKPYSIAFSGVVPTDQKTYKCWAKKFIKKILSTGVEINCSHLIELPKCSFSFSVGYLHYGGDRFFITNAPQSVNENQVAVEGYSYTTLERDVTSIIGGGDARLAKVVADILPSDHPKLLEAIFKIGHAPGCTSIEFDTVETK